MSRLINITGVRGVHPPPETMMHFAPLFQISIPLFSKNLKTLRKLLTILPFPEKFLHFHPLKFLMTFFLFFSYRPQIPPYFPCFSTFPPFFSKIIISHPALTNVPLF